MKEREILYPSLQTCSILSAVLVKMNILLNQTDFYLCLENTSYLLNETLVPTFPHFQDGKITVSNCALSR